MDVQAPICVFSFRSRNVGARRLQRLARVHGLLQVLEQQRPDLAVDPAHVAALEARPQLVVPRQVAVVAELWCKQTPGEEVLP